MANYFANYNADYFADYWPTWGDIEPWAGFLRLFAVVSQPTITSVVSQPTITAKIEV